MHDDKGFTLVEALVALALLGLLVSGGLGIFQTLIKASSKAYENSLLAASISSCAQEIGYEVGKTGKLSSDEGDFGGTLPGYKWNASIEDVESELVLKNSLKRVVITVSSSEQQENPCSFSFVVKVGN